MKGFSLLQHSLSILFSFLLLLLIVSISFTLSFAAEKERENNNAALHLTPQEAEKIAKRIAAERISHGDKKEETHTETRYRWVTKREKAKKEEEKENDSSFLKFFFKRLANAIEPFANFFAGIGQFIIVVLLIAPLIFYLLKSRFFEGGITAVRKQKESAPQTVFGMDISPASIPENPEIESLKLWQKGEHREALSLLYRAALSILIHSAAIPIHPSFTELECQKKISEQAGKKEAHYFKKLTNCWIKMAYAHRIVTEKEHQELVEEWKEVFAL